MKNNHRIFQYDFIRAFAIITVVANHICTTFADTPVEIEVKEYLNTVLRFSVPLFLFLSGAFFHKNADLTYLKKKFLKVLIPYSVISIPATAFLCWKYNWRFENLPEIISSYVFGYQFGFYFIFLILVLYILGYFIVKSKLIKKPNALLIGTLLLHFIWLAIDESVYNHFGLKEISFLQFNLNDFIFFRNPLTWLPFFALGLWYQEEKSKEFIAKNKIIIGISLIASFTLYNLQMFLHFGDYTPYGSIIWSIFSTLIILFLLNLNLKQWENRKCVEYLSEKSFSIFLIHGFLIHALLEIENILGINFPYALAFLFFPAVILASIAVIYAVKKITGSRSELVIGS